MNSFRPAPRAIGQFRFVPKPLPWPVSSLRPVHGYQEMVRAEVEHRAVFIEDVLRAVAVMHVPIDDQHLAQMVLVLCIAGGDGGVVEHAEAHAARGRGMVSRRPRQTEGVFRLAVEHGVDGHAAGPLA